MLPCYSQDFFETHLFIHMPLVITDNIILEHLPHNVHRRRNHGGNAHCTIHLNIRFKILIKLLRIFDALVSEVTPDSSAKKKKLQTIQCHTASKTFPQQACCLCRTTRKKICPNKIGRAILYSYSTSC